MKRLLSLLLVLTLAACAGNPLGADAPVALPASPLPTPMQATSPLPPPGPQIGAPLPPAVVAPRVAMVIRPVAFLPLLSAGIAPEYVPCAANATSLRLSELFATSDWQNRTNARCHPLLALAAERKTAEFAALDYVSHTSPSGVGPNENVRATGFILPDDYGLTTNSVESIAGGYSSVDEVLAAWRTSFLHWQHLSASAEFFRLQNCFGVSYFYSDLPGFHHFWVLVSAPCPPGF